MALGIPPRRRPAVGDGQRPARVGAAHPPADRGSQRRPQRVRRHLVRQGRGGDRDVRGVAGPGEIPRRRAALHDEARMGRGDRGRLLRRPRGRRTKRCCPRFADSWTGPAFRSSRSASTAPAARASRSGSRGFSRRVRPPIRSSAGCSPRAFCSATRTGAGRSARWCATRRPSSRSTPPSCPQWVIGNRAGIGYFLPALSPGALRGNSEGGNRAGADGLACAARRHRRPRARGGRPAAGRADARRPRREADPPARLRRGARDRRKRAACADSGARRHALRGMGACAVRFARTCARLAAEARRRRGHAGAAPVAPALRRGPWQRRPTRGRGAHASAAMAEGSASRARRRSRRASLHGGAHGGSRGRRPVRALRGRGQGRALSPGTPRRDHGAGRLSRSRARAASRRAGAGGAVRRAARRC